MSNNEEHWEAVWRAKEPDQLSWYQSSAQL